MDLVFTLKIILEKSWELDITKDIMLKDLEKTLDRVTRERLWNILN